MAFNTNAAVNTGPRANNENWKASGFINLYLPSKNGTRRKLGAIPLKENNVNEKALYDWLKEDPSRVATLLAKLQMDFRPAEADPGSAFDLDDAPAAPAKAGKK